MKEFITAGILMITSIIAFVISIRSFNEKGILFNNAYLYASRQERNQMDKKPYYKQSGIVFLLIAIIFLLNSIAVILNTGWIFYVVIVLAAIAVIYAIVSSIMIEVGKRR